MTSGEPLEGVAKEAVVCPLLFLRNSRGKSHKNYLSDLGMKDTRIFLGYDVVDNDYFAKAARLARTRAEMTLLQSLAIPRRPYFFAMTRLIPRKNVERLVSAFSSYRTEIKVDAPWDLVICGSGIQEKVIREVIQANGLDSFVHLPGFIPYEHVGAGMVWRPLSFILPCKNSGDWLSTKHAQPPSRFYAAAQSVQLRNSFVKERTDMFLIHWTQERSLRTSKMHQLSEDERLQMGESSARIVAQFTPQHFAEGLIQAIDTGSISLELLRLFSSTFRRFDSILR